jgi:hypothetical protein
LRKNNLSTLSQVAETVASYQSSYQSGPSVLSIHFLDEFHFCLYTVQMISGLKVVLEICATEEQAVTDGSIIIVLVKCEKQPRCTKIVGQ